MRRCLSRRFQFACVSTVRYCDRVGICQLRLFKLDDLIHVSPPEHIWPLLFPESGRPVTAQRGATGTIGIFALVLTHLRTQIPGYKALPPSTFEQFRLTIICIDWGFARGFQGEAQPGGSTGGDSTLPVGVDTFGRLFWQVDRKLDPSQFEAVFLHWMQGMLLAFVARAWPSTARLGGIRAARDKKSNGINIL